MIDAGDTGRDTRDTWDRILSEGEHILWQGSPAPGLHLSKYDRLQMASGLALIVGCQLFFRLSPNGPGFPPVIYAALTVFGLWQFLSPPLLGQLYRRYSFYTLTNRRAFIGRDMPVFGRSLRSWPIGSASKLEHVSHANGLDSIYFATQSQHWYSRKERSRPVGFERIADAAKVLNMMSDLQKTTPGGRA